MTQNTPSKKEYVALSDFRYRLRKFQRFSEKITRKAGVTNLQYLLLLHIKGQTDREWATIGELAERLQAQHHGTVALVTRCEKLGLVVRRAGREDGRVVEVSLTPGGDRMIAKLAARHRDELMRLEGVFKIPDARDFT